MQATDLGRYLLYGRDADFLAVDGDSIAPAAEPSDDSDWTVREDGDAFTIVNTFVDRGLGVDGSGGLVTVPSSDAARFDFTESSGCPEYPEVDVNAVGTGDRLTGLRRGGRVRRRPHARDGVRVPRRQGALRQAVGPVRRSVRAA